jgi:hypothetical protein
MGIIEGNKEAHPNDWEQIKRKGDKDIENWIDNNIKGTSCTIVLVGSQTSERPWIRHEIKRSWELDKALFGIRVHGLKCNNGYTSHYGDNPFDKFTLTSDSRKLSEIIRCYEPIGYSSQDKYAHIKNNIASWIEEAIAVKNRGLSY